MGANCPEGCVTRQLCNRLEVEADPETIIKERAPGFTHYKWEYRAGDADTKELVKVNLTDIHWTAEDILSYDLVVDDKHLTSEDPVQRAKAEKRVLQLATINEEFKKRAVPAEAARQAIEACQGMIEVTAPDGRTVEICGAELIIPIQEAADAV